ncbi:sensor histidine kinase [Chitinophaga nivalis]|uniref:histidine kinase n=1 Tax=Chitinophaga nivalis TaxID=2991709 RepID=A0ABT3ITI4_9BACT|nr:HAMP domain-containing sensor histidine kinase [Chitinophaga nivalis]MCW3463001.1 HAMP domain-containing histidine kinase [Chitinophaga nivalis]MCW3487309.1 HAMP domain-containing histidine kinase [Chitinophaga nivalis]
MKLINKLTMWFIGVVVLTTPISAYLCYYNMESNIDATEIARLTKVNEAAASQLQKGIPVSTITQGMSTRITLLNTPLPAEKIQIKKIAPTDHSTEESCLKVNSYFTINQQNYQICSYNYIPGSALIRNAILNTVLWKLALIILCVCITARLVSQRLLNTLRHTMKIIQGFNVKQKIQFPESRTQEFKDLNSFLQKMTDKAVDEYAAIKEFSENASHELQTPLAVLRNKLELLSETNIEENQAGLIGDMQHAIEKLSRINRSLILLAKLENNEYAVSENIKFCRVAKDVLAAYEDRIEMKNISITTDMEKNIFLKVHPALADMLFNNLLGNAIRHNVQNGRIEIILTAGKLVVKNTGIPPEIPMEDLFLRFKKGNQCSESVGLGLSIVKQICEVSGFHVSYTYENQLHVLQVDFQTPQENMLKAVHHNNLEVAV